MKFPSRLTEEARWHSDGDWIVKPAGTPCHRLDGDLSEYGTKDDAGTVERTIQERRRRGENWTAILLGGRVRMVKREMVEDVTE